MRVLVSGATGLVGTALVPALERAGHEVVALSRSPGERDTVLWRPTEGEIDRFGLDGIDAAIHLAGEPLFGRWTDAKKRRIRDSRVEGTRLLAEALAERSEPPLAMVCASAVGYYGDRGDEVLDEDSAAGDGFLADVCREWEAAADPARQAGTRVVHTRFGLVLAREGGVLQKMLTPFRLGLGGRVGDGTQYWSWVALDDVVRVLLHALDAVEVSGPVNVVAPQACTCETFVKTLGDVLRRPTVVPVPAFAARLALGEMADEAILASQRVQPARLTAQGFVFEHPELAPALRHILDRG